MSATVIERWVRVFTDPARALEVRLAAASSLLKMGEPEAISACVDFLDMAPSRTPAGRSYRELLVTQGGPHEALEVLLWDPDPVLRCAAVDKLREQGDPAAIPELCHALHRHEKHIHYRLSVLNALAALVTEADSRPAMAAVELIVHPHQKVRKAAARVLQRSKTAAMAATPRMVVLLTAARGAVRFEGTELLPSLAPASMCAHYLLRVLDEETDELLCWLARFELTRLPVQAVEAIQAA